MNDAQCPRALARALRAVRAVVVAML